MANGSIHLHSSIVIYRRVATANPQRSSHYISHSSTIVVAAFKKTLVQLTSGQVQLVLRG